MKLERDVYLAAVDHLTSRGDTDLFPYPFELKFLSECREQIADNLSSFDLQNYHPLSLVEILVPKTKFGFRIGHQPYPIDTLIYTALVLSIFDKVEEGRDKIELNRAFSYRKKIGLHVDIFVENRMYRNWLEHLRSYVFNEDYTHVVRTDISDFYQRIYRHRLENILESLSGNKSITKKIEKFIADWRSNQSFGIPVGTSASRLLAEAALNDTDLALISEGYEFSRYVDDFVVFVRTGHDPYAALGFLAKHFSANEGLSLNNQKTRILEWDEFIAGIRTPSAEDDDTTQDFATEKLFWAAYGQDELDQDALEALTLKDLKKEIEQLLAEDFWDMGAIRVVLHAMRLVRNSEAASYVRAHLSDLVPFAKDVCLLVQEFSEAGVAGFENLSAEVTDLLLSPRMQPLEGARAWFLELGVRNVVKFDSAQLRRLEALSGTLDVRQMHLLRWRANDQNYFRSRKTRLNEINTWAQPSFIFGARCLPRDEYSHWLRGIKSRVEFPLGREFVDWCMNSYGRDPLQ